MLPPGKDIGIKARLNGTALMQYPLASAGVPTPTRRGMASRHGSASLQGALTSSLSLDFVKQTRDDARPRARLTARSKTHHDIVYPDNFPAVGAADRRRKLFAALPVCEKHRATPSRWHPAISPGRQS